MAFVDYSLDFGEDKVEYPYIYNVSYAVGYIGGNCRDDVLRVQYFLKKIWERVKGAMPPSGTMVVDGTDYRSVDSRFSERTYLRPTATNRDGP
jgi:hypothetical protein